MLGISMYTTILYDAHRGSVFLQVTTPYKQSAVTYYHIVWCNSRVTASWELRHRLDNTVMTELNPLNHPPADVWRSTLLEASYCTRSPPGRHK